MSDGVILFGLVIVMEILGVLFGIAIGCYAKGKNNKQAEEYFLRRDGYREREKILKNELAAEHESRIRWQKEALLLRDEAYSLNNEIGELRFELRKSKEKK